MPMSTWRVAAIVVTGGRVRAAPMEGVVLDMTCSLCLWLWLGCFQGVDCLAVLAYQWRDDRERCGLGAQPPELARGAAHPPLGALGAAGGTP